jgi:hypothetical protein
LDKHRENRTTLLIAPVRPLSTVPSDTAKAILANRKFAAIPLVGLPQLGDAYADLRLISPLDRKVADDITRLRSMTDAAVEFLRIRVVHFFARADDLDEEETLPLATGL